jgi:hypothetical protein
MLGILLMSGIVWTSSAQAIPAFARKYDKACASCHTAWPQLNRAGRMFKEAGYQFPSDPKEAQQISDFLYLDKSFPISATLVARPYDKKDNSRKKVRAIHEIEIIMAGVLGKQWSGYFEIEAEDETNFDPEFAPAVLNYHYNKALNLQFVWGPMFWADPYGFLGDHFRLTRGHVGVIDQKFGGADKDGKLRSTRQNVILSGRPMNKLFYSVGFSGETSDAEGVDASNVSGRVAIDVTRNIMIGAFAVSGETEESSTTSTTTATVGGTPNVVVETTTTTPKRDFNRRGLDAQADIGNARIQAAFIKAEDDNSTLPVPTSKDKNDAWSIQGIYVFKVGKRPTWVPVIRLDNYEKSAGVDEYTELTLNLTRYFTQNIKAYIEYWDQLDVPTGEKEDRRLTLQIVAAF